MKITSSEIRIKVGNAVKGFHFSNGIRMNVAVLCDTSIRQIPGSIAL